MDDKEPAEVSYQPVNKKKKLSSKRLKVLIGALILVLVALLIWLWFACNKKEQDLEQKNKDLQKQVQDLRKELKEAKKSSQADVDEETDEVCLEVSDDLRSNIHDAVTSENYAALEGFMTSPITVVYAATEFGGPKTPAEAVSALDYLSNGTSPWDFSLSAPTIEGYSDGDYGEYFPDGAYVGRAANSMVVSFAFTCDQISQIFISAQEEIL